MKRLIVMRHAKSDWDSDAPTDHARPLNKRGRRDSPRVASKLVELSWTPQLVLSSDAQRTRETFELMVPEFSPPPTVDFLSSLYHAGPEELAESLASIPDSTATVMTLGHNPGWEEVVYWLTKQTVRMTTANAALIECETESWSDVVRHAGNWSLLDMIRPKEM